MVLLWHGGTGTSIGNLSYTWDANKNKTSETIGGTMSGYGFTSAGTSYDDEDRLTGYARTSGTFTQSWNLTKIGDWTSVTTNGTAQNRTHGPTHELLTAGGQSLETDPKGNITLLPTVLSSSLTPQASRLIWDFDNKLRSADLGNNSSVDVNFQYDALGRRVARTGTGGSVVYVQHDQQTIADYPVGGVASTPTYRYIYASYIDEPVVRKAAGTSGTIHYYHRNQQYSITAMTTSTGAVAERYAYTAYGQPTILNASGSVLTSSAVGNRYTYTGREWDETLGLHHFRARWMSPLAGRFLGRDPIGYVEGPSLVQFLSSNACGGLDPTGFCDTIVRPKRRTPTEKLKGLTQRCKNSPNGRVYVDPEELWYIVKSKKGYWDWPFVRCKEYDYFKRGCMGVTGCLLGREAHSALGTGDCYLSLEEAISWQSKKECGCNKAEIIGFTFKEIPNSKPSIPVVDPNGRITCYQQPYGMEGNIPCGGSYDFGFYFEGCFFHAQGAFHGSCQALCSEPEVFHNFNGTEGYQTIYCVECSGSSPTPSKQ